MKFSIEDREYEFEAKITVEEAMIIQDKAGLGLTEFDPALGRGNPYAIAALMLILKKRAGEAVRWQDLLKLDAMTFRMIPDEIPDLPDADDAPATRAAAPDPTSPPGKTRKRATSST
jgi:hypothetical protein